MTHVGVQYGKLSDIYGRKSMVISAYFIFTLGWYVSLQHLIVSKHARLTVKIVLLCMYT